MSFSPCDWPIETAIWVNHKGPLPSGERTQLLLSHWESLPPSSRSEPSVRDQPFRRRGQPVINRPSLYRPSHHEAILIASDSSELKAILSWHFPTHRKHLHKESEEPRNPSVGGPAATLFKGTGKGLWNIGLSALLFRKCQ